MYSNLNLLIKNIKKTLGFKPDLYDYVVENKKFPNIENICNFDLKSLTDLKGKLLVYCINSYNKYELDINEEQWKFIIEQSGMKYHHIKILDKLISKSDIDGIKLRNFPNIFWKNLFLHTGVNFLSLTPLSLYFKYKKTLNCYLTPTQLLFLIKNTNLNIRSLEGYTAYHYAIRYYQENDLQLTPEMFQLLREGSPSNIDISYYINMHLSKEFQYLLPHFTQTDFDIFYHRFIKEKYQFNNNIYFQQILASIEHIRQKSLSNINTITINTNNINTTTNTIYSNPDDFFTNIKPKTKKTINLEF